MPEESSPEMRIFGEQICTAVHKFHAYYSWYFVLNFGFTVSINEANQKVRPPKAKVHFSVSSNGLCYSGLTTGESKGHNPKHHFLSTESFKMQNPHSTEVKGCAPSSVKNLEQIFFNSKTFSS